MSAFFNYLRTLRALFIPPKIYPKLTIFNNILSVTRAIKLPWFFCYQHLWRPHSYDIGNEELTFNMDVIVSGTFRSAFLLPYLLLFATCCLILLHLVRALSKI